MFVYCLTYYKYVDYENKDSEYFVQVGTGCCQVIVSLCFSFHGFQFDKQFWATSSICIDITTFSVFSTRFSSEFYKTKF